MDTVWDDVLKQLRILAVTNPTALTPRQQECVQLSERLADVRRDVLAELAEGRNARAAAWSEAMAESAAASAARVQHVRWFEEATEPVTNLTTEVV